MSERYPEEAALLAIEQDAHTGVEYIRTGQSPYYVAFRRMLHRLLEATRRANDLRVYQDGDLTIGVRAGRCAIDGEAIAFDGQTGLSVADDATTHVWLDAEGAVQQATDGLAADRTAVVPLAKVTTADGAITAIEDLRGEAFLLIPSLAGLGVEASAETLNAALADADESVTSEALNTLTGGLTTVADLYHQHEQFTREAGQMEQFTLVNNGWEAETNIALAFALPGLLAEVTKLHPDNATGWLQQTIDGETRSLVGAAQVSYGHGGALTGSQSGALMGVVPLDGEVVAVVLSAGANVESSDGADHVEAVVKVNGQTVTATEPRLAADDGAGFRCTDRGDGVAATVASDGSEQVQRGDVLTVDLTRTVNGTVSSEASDVAVLVVIRAAQPE